MNDEAWQKIFEKLDIIQAINKHGHFFVSAKQINEIGQREARLMAKFDTRESLPKLYKEYELNINAVSNGNYIIFKDPGHRSFINLPDFSSIPIVKVAPVLDFPLETLIFAPHLTESNSIDFAQHSGILANCLKQKDLKLTTRGRFFSDKFKIVLESVGGVEVQSVQIEVDAGFESPEQFIIIEAKSGTRNTFNIRQLFYPFSHFAKRTKKEIRNILLSFSNGVYYFTEIQLGQDYYNYKIVAQQAVEVIVPEEIIETSLMALVNLPHKVKTNFPVPQADDLNKVIDLVNLLGVDQLTKYEIASNFDFDERQGDYYGNAACFLGLAEKIDTNYRLTNDGVVISSIRNRENRNIHLAKAILRTPLFNDLIKLYINQGGNLTDGQIKNRLLEEQLGEATAERRKSTIKAWINWLVANIRVA